MSKILCAAFAAAVGAIGLAACDAAAPPDAAVSRPVEPEAVAEPEPTAEPEAMAESEVLALAETLAGVVRNEDVFARVRRLGELLPTLGPEAVPAVETTLKDPRLEYGATEVDLLVRFWATHQPEDASRWAALESRYVDRAPAILASFMLWAEKDPQAVLAASKQWGRQPREVRQAMHLALVRGWFAANPSELAQFIKDIGMGLDRQRVVAAYVATMIQRQGIDAVVRWAESLPGDDRVYKTTVYRQVGSALPTFDHEASMRWCEAHCDGPYGNNLRNITARRWALTDGAAALAWLSTAPEGHEKNLAVRSALAAWGEANPEAARAWMAARTAEELDSWLRPAIPVCARLHLRDSPAEAIEWAERMEANAERESLLIRAARAWRQVDEAAADAWLLQSSLSEEARAKVRGLEQAPGAAEQEPQPTGQEDG